MKNQIQGERRGRERGLREEGIEVEERGRLTFQGCIYFSNQNQYTKSELPGGLVSSQIVEATTKF